MLIFLTKDSQVVNELQWNITVKKWPCCTYCTCVSCFPKSSHLYLPLPGEEASVFKCSVSRETECSRVGKQSFIITLGCNSVLLQFSSPAGMYHTSQRECSTLHRGDTEVVMCMHEAVLLLCWLLPLTSEEKSTQYLTSNMVVVFLQSNTKKKILALWLFARVFDRSLILITFWTNTETDQNNTASKKRGGDNKYRAHPVLTLV